MSNTDKRAWVDNSFYAVKSTTSIEKMVQTMTKKGSFVYMSTRGMRGESLLGKIGMILPGCLYLNQDKKLVWRNFPHQTKGDPGYIDVPQSNVMDLKLMGRSSVDMIHVIDSLELKDQPEFHSVETLWERLFDRADNPIDVWERTEVYFRNKSGDRVSVWDLEQDKQHYDPRPVDRTLHNRRASPHRSGMLTPLDHMAMEMNGLNKGR